MAWADGVAARETMRPGEAADSQGSSYSDVAAGVGRVSFSFSEDFSPADAIVGRLRYFGLVSDDSASFWADLVNHVLEAVGGGPTPINVSDVADALAAADAATARMTLFGLLSESASFSDALAAYQTLLAAAADSLPADDAVTARLRLLAALADAGSWDDLAAHVLASGGTTPIYVTDIQDAVALADAVSSLFRFRADVSEALGITEDLAARERFLAAISESASFSDGASAITGLLGILTDGTSLADLATARELLLAQPEDLAAGTDDATARMRFFADLAEAQTWDDLVERNSFVTGLEAVRALAVYLGPEKVARALARYCANYLGPDKQARVQ